jgi:hypothetical protein
MTLGGFMGKAMDVGVPGAEGTGEPTANPEPSMVPRTDR